MTAMRFEAHHLTRIAHSRIFASSTRRSRAGRTAPRPARHLVLAVEQADADAVTRSSLTSRGSIAFRRPIIASTRARTCSFFCSRLRARHERVLPLAQGAVFFLELADGGDEFVDAPFEPFQFGVDRGPGGGSLSEEL